MSTHVPDSSSGPVTPSPAAAGGGQGDVPARNQNLTDPARPDYVRVQTREWDRVNGERDSLRDLYKKLAAENRALLKTTETDPLTGVGNMRALDKAFHIRLENLRRAEPGSRAARGGGLVFLDGDGFGQVNKIYGDHVGDQVIQAIAASLEKNIRAGDMVFRKGGDEFVLILSDIAEGDIQNVVHGPGGIQERVNATTQVITGTGLLIDVQCSMGAVHFTADDSLGAMLQCADIAMRANKSARKQQKK